MAEAKVPERWLSYWNRESSIDATIWACDPFTLRFELTNHTAEREAELIREVKRAGAQLARSKFPNFW